MSVDIHPHGYWTIKNRRYRFDKRLAAAIADIAEVADVKSIIDVGCGGGAYTSFLSDRGFRVDGYDGNPHTYEITGGLCRTADFATILDLSHKDMVLCLEVAEHIPKFRQGIFINNLLSMEPNLIVISWAVEGQGGIGHINCRNNDYVINLFERYDYTYLDWESLHLRKQSKIKWFKDTVMVYERLGNSSIDV